MRAARFRGNQQIEIVDEPTPVPRPGEVLLKVAYCGLCGSDKRPYRDGFPLIPGHEVSGIVIDANGCAVQVGTRAVAYLNVYCGTCRYCRQGATNRCPDAKGLLGWSAPWNGGYAQFMSVPAIDIIPLDPRVGLDAGVLLLDTSAPPGTASAWVTPNQPAGPWSLAADRSGSAPLPVSSPSA